jgi:hypothetical protein
MNKTGRGWEAGGVAKAIAIMKNRAALLLGGSRPEGDVLHVKLRNLFPRDFSGTAV